MGNIFGDAGMPKLRKTGTFSGTKPDFLAKKNQDAAPPPPPASTVDVSNVKLVKVEFDYTAENTDEITLKKGQFIRGKCVGDVSSVCVCPRLSTAGMEYCKSTN